MNFWETQRNQRVLTHVISFHSGQSNGFISIREEEVDIRQQFYEFSRAFVAHIRSSYSSKWKFSTDFFHQFILIPKLKKKSFPHSCACFAKCITRSVLTIIRTNFSLKSFKLVLNVIKFVFRVLVIYKKPNPTLDTVFSMRIIF